MPILLSSSIFELAKHEKFTRWSRPDVCKNFCTAVISVRITLGVLHMWQLCADDPALLREFANGVLRANRSMGDVIFSPLFAHSRLWALGPEREIKKLASLVR